MKARRRGASIAGRERTWAPIDNVNDPNTTFRVDAQIEALIASGSLEYQSLGHVDELTSRVRRALEVATFEALSAHQHQAEIRAGISPAGAQSWLALSNGAAEAQVRIDRLIRKLGPDRRRAKEAHELLHVLRQVFGPSSPRPAEIARELWQAHGALQAVAEASEAIYRHIKGARKNEGQSDKQRFVRTFVEFWIAVTGRKPPAGEDTPFMGLLRAAWEDSGQRLSWGRGRAYASESFQSSLRAIVRSLSADEVAKLRDNPPF